MAEPLKMTLLRAELDMRNPPSGDRLFQLQTDLETAEKRLQAMGIHLVPDDQSDTSLQVSYAGWLYRRRNDKDAPTAMPKWLSFDIKNRLLHEAGKRGGAV